MPSSDLFNLAADYLTAVVAALADTPAGSPSVFYVSPGVPALDCDQVTVHVGGPLVAGTSTPAALGADHRITVAQVNMIRLTAVVIRCCPTISQDGTPPSPADQNAAAAQTSADVWAVWNHIATAFRAGTVFSGEQGCREFAFDPAIPVSIEGGLCGWQIPMHVQLGGYRPGE